MKRILSLDAFRGLTIAAMILVNSPGNQTSYTFLNHSEWNGCQFADFVFPGFLFIVGVSIAYSFARLRLQPGSFWSLFVKISRRTLILFLIGIFLNAFPRHMNFETLRIPGVLQRIAICYFFTSIIFLTMRIRTQVMIIVSLVVGYWLLLLLIPAPGFTAYDLSPIGNLPAYIDRWFFTSAHLYTANFDPEGILSTLPAIASTLIGAVIGVLLQSNIGLKQKYQRMILAGIMLAVIGLLWGTVFPMNKALWTSSFVLWTSGVFILILSLFHWVIDIKGWQLWSIPLIIFGVNAIAAYFLHIFFLKIQAMIHLPRVDGSMGNLRIYITEHLFFWTTPKMASLMYAVCYVLLWLALLGWMYRKKIFLRV